jgi:sarcosine oxidase
MTQPYDVAVAGLGAMGSAASYHLARRGLRVLGIDRFSPPHGMGSSHGRSRMIREAYFEHPLYVPLVQRAYELWAELERTVGHQFLLQTGGLMIGPEHGTLVQGTIRSAIEFSLPHEVIPAARLHRDYPAFAPLDGMVGVLEHRAGILLPEAIIAAHLQLAESHGAELRRDTVVEGWDRTAEGIELRVAGETVHARHLVVAVGAWMAPFVRSLALPLTVERQVIYWFDPVRFPEYHLADRMPVSIWELEDGTLFYTKPDLGDGVKIGIHHGGQLTTPDRVDRRISNEEDAAVYDLLRRFVPFAKGHLRDRSTCLYTNTPDADFIVDRHPEADEVIVLSPCSGHGFKFSSVLGEIAADLVTTGSSRFDLSPFALSRFGPAAL